MSKKLQFFQRGDQFTGPITEEISALAYQLYQGQGCQTGNQLQHWLEAEAWLRYRNQDGARFELIHFPGANFNRN